MAAKRLTYDADAREALRSGVNQLARAVKGTMGPRGKNVVIEQGFGSPTVTKDGVAVAEEVELEDGLEDIGAQIVKEAASNTSDLAGDGTTTATVLAEAVFEESLKNLAAGADPMSLRRGVEKATEALVDELQELAEPVHGRQDIAFVGSIAANNDRDVGEQIADAMEKVGKDGVITVEEGQGLHTTVDLVEGMQFDRGYLSPHFVTDREEMEVVLEDCYVLLCEEKISSVQELVPLMEQISQQDSPVLIIAEDVEGEALATLVVNKLRGVLQGAAVKAPRTSARPARSSSTRTPPPSWKAPATATPSRAVSSKSSGKSAKRTAITTARSWKNVSRGSPEASPRSTWVPRPRWK